MEAGKGIWMSTIYEKTSKPEKHQSILKKV